MNDFSTGLFECFTDCGVCLYVSFCRECAAADNWARSRGEDCNICHVLSPVPIWTRDNIRTMLGQREKRYFTDCVTYAFCYSCAVCQDMRELNRIRQQARNGYIGDNSSDEARLETVQVGQPFVDDGAQFQQPLIIAPTYPQVSPYQQQAVMLPQYPSV